MPNPNPSEGRMEFVHRCIPVVHDEEPGYKNDYYVAKCFGIFRQHQKNSRTSQKTPAK